MLMFNGLTVRYEIVTSWHCTERNDYGTPVAAKTLFTRISKFKKCASSNGKKKIYTHTYIRSWMVLL